MTDPSQGTLKSKLLDHRSVGSSSKKTQGILLPAFETSTVPVRRSRAIENKNKLSPDKAGISEQFLQQSAEPITSSKYESMMLTT